MMSMMYTKEGLEFERIEELENEKEHNQMAVRTDMEVLVLTCVHDLRVLSNAIDPQRFPKLREVLFWLDFLPEGFRSHDWSVDKS